VFPAAAVLAGGASANHELNVRLYFAALLASLAWGVGQVVNDRFDVAADRIDAPDRPMVREPLPVRTVLCVALLVGTAIALGFYACAPNSWPLLLASALLMVSYTWFKRWPLVGNLAFAALLGAAALLGLQVASGQEKFVFPASDAQTRIALVMLIAATYVQANYEKDLPGDQAAGYRTLASLIGLRASAALRLIAYATVGAIAVNSPTSPFGIFLLTVGTANGVVSAAGVLIGPQPSRAQRGYRSAVHSAAFSLLALGIGTVPAVTAGDKARLVPTDIVIGGLALLSVLLIERAFRLSPNP
jgi:4-hydroxybenzoate polyprenyltransferase